MPTRESTDVLLPFTEASPVHRAQAARVVASAAVDAEECATLLDMLGLNPAEGLAPPGAPRSTGSCLP